MRILPRLTQATPWLLAALAGACGTEDRAAPTPEMAIAKTDTLSGDQQVGTPDNEVTDANGVSWARCAYHCMVHGSPGGGGHVRHDHRGRVLPRLL
jgi:hypothetical protein